MKASSQERLCSPRIPAFAAGVAYLILSGHGVFIQDDDSGGNLNARIIFTPTVTGTYNLYATTFVRGQRGAYRISVLP